MWYAFQAMATNVQVAKQSNENTQGLIRRFTKRVRGSGVLQRARVNRFYNRSQSKLLRKKRALKGIQQRERREEDLKLGKVVEQKNKRWKRR